MRFKKILFVGGSTICLLTAVFIVQSYRQQMVLYEKKFKVFNQWGKIYESQENSSPALYYCNFPSTLNYITADEGRLKNPRWILKQIQVVIRHGDRSPIDFKFYNKLGVVPDYCQLKPDRQPTHPSLQNFIKTVTLDHTKILKQGRRLAATPFPNHPKCQSGELSQLGVVQHLHNGEILRKAYVNVHHLLSDAIRNQTMFAHKVHVVSTLRSRTIQSAIALLYGLIPNFHLDKVELKYSNSDIFFSGPCKTAWQMGESIKHLEYKMYLNQREKPAFRKLVKYFQAGDHAGSLIDKFVTGFLCKKLELPCNGTNCADLEDLDVLLRSREETMREISEKATFVNQSMLLLQPVLDKISNFMELRSLAESAPDVVLFSGHDTTLKPLISALGIPEYRWPRLGTRLVFELWFDPVERENYVRILLNGKDYTMRTRPCRYSARTDLSKGVCKAEMFRSFVKTRIFEHFGVKKRFEACGIDVDG